MTDREFRLRERIDALIDERDRLRNRVAKLERLYKKQNNRAYAASRSRDLWRVRACNGSCASKKKQGRPLALASATDGPNNKGV